MNAAVDKAPQDLAPERAHPRLWAASWCFWLLILAAGFGLLAHRVRVHKEAMAAGRQVWALRYELCKSFSAAPRPPWQECLARAAESEGLLSAQSADYGDAAPR